MIRCKEVATLMSTDQLASQPMWRRAGARVHLLMCRHCRRFARQLVLLKRAAAGLGATFDAEVGADFAQRAQNKLRSR